MTKRFLAVAVVMAFVALCIPLVQAQTAIVKGSVKDMEGKPMVGVTVQLVSKDTGRKYTIKTDKKGEYYSLGIEAPRNYVFNLIKDGQTLLSDEVSVASGEVTHDFDLQKRAAEAQHGVGPGGKPAPLTEEQKKALKEREEAEKENVHVKGLNEMLAQANTAQQAGNYDQAVSILQQAVQTDVTRDILWMRLADAQRLAAAKAADKAARNKEYQDSVEAYKKAIALKQEKPTASTTNVGDYWNNLADSYYKLSVSAESSDARQSMLQEAINAYQQAIQANPPGAAMYYFNLGAVYTNTGKNDLAIEAFDKCIAANPNRADAYYQKGVALLGKAKLEGDKMVAPPGTAEAFNKYLELEPTGQFAEPAKAMLAQIGATVQTNYGTRKKK